MTSVHITIDTEDLALVERIGKALNGSTYLPGAVESAEREGPQTPTPDAPKPQEPARAGVEYSHDAADRLTDRDPTPTPDAPKPQEPGGSEAARAFGNAPKPHADTPRPTPGEELDEDGLPWDERINTANKGKTQGGVWKRKPKISDELYDEVKAELRRVMAAGPAVTAPQPEQEQAAAPPPPPAPEADSEQTAGPTPPPPPGQPVQDIKFPQLVRRVTAEAIPQATLAQVLNRHGLVRMPDLMKQQHLVPEVYAELFPEG